MTFDMHAARANFRARERQRIEALASRREALRACLPEAARLLRNEFGATRVRVFGSLATGDLSGDVDIDLAVDGLPPLQQFKALGALQQLLPAPVDLVLVEEAPHTLRLRIDAEGEDL